jgi:hypothetical protein
MSFRVAANVYGLAMWRYSVIRQPVTDAKFITKYSLFILLTGIFRLLKPEPTKDIQPIVYPSPRHIAKPHVARRILSPAMKMEVQ